MATKILLIRRIQKDEDWNVDCHKIGTKIASKLNYTFPYPEYFKLLAECLGEYIAHKEIYLNEPCSIDHLFYEVFRQGFNYALAHNKSANYFEFKITDAEKDKIKTSIDECIKLYYTEEKKDILNKLDLLPKDVILIYPQKFYSNILKHFYKHNFNTFESQYNNDEDCIKEFCKVNNVTEYEIVTL